MEQSRLKYLFKNTAIFTIGNFASKLISFFLVPLYTNALSTAEYGIADLITTICTVLTPIIVLNISDSVLRYCLDKNADYKKIFSVGIFMYMIGSVIGLLIFPINILFNATSSYSAYIYFYTVSAAGSQVFLAYLRGKEKLGLYTIGNILQSLCIAVLNILFLVYFNWGVQGYFLAYIVSATFTMIYSFVAGNCISIIRKFNLDKSLLVEMIKYSVILIPNTFMWWIINSSDRIMVTSLVGIAANGIYAVSYKIPSIVSIISSIVNQAWGYSAVKENDSKDRDQFTNKMFTFLLASSIISSVFLMLIIKPLLKMYVEVNYYDAWKYSPLLLIGNVFLTIGTFLGTPYFVNKDNKHYLYSSLCGAVINILLNFALIPTMGVTGAALATCVSYIVICVYRAINTKKYISIELLSRRNIFSYIILGVAGFTVFLNGGSCYLLLGIELIFEILLFKKEIIMFISNLMQRGN